MTKKITILASGSESGGGSGFEKLVESVEAGVLDAQIVAVASNHEHGGVRDRADRLGIPFIYFPKPWSAAAYQEVMQESGGEYAALSGWLKLVKGLDGSKTFNIHPALLSKLDGRFGGKGMWGHHVHEAVKAAYDAGEITETGLTMHFVTSEYDMGPAFFEMKVPITPEMSADDIGSAVNALEHKYQAFVTNLVVQGLITWDGENRESLDISQKCKELFKKEFGGEFPIGEQTR